MAFFNICENTRSLCVEGALFAVVLQHIDRRLRKHHSQIDEQNRSRIVQRVRTLEAVAHNKEDVEYPQASEKQVEGLEFFKDGLQCMGQ